MSNVKKKRDSDTNTNQSTDKNGSHHSERVFNPFQCTPRPFSSVLMNGFQSNVQPQQMSEPGESAAMVLHDGLMESGNKAQLKALIDAITDTADIRLLRHFLSAAYDHATAQAFASAALHVLGEEQ